MKGLKDSTVVNSVLYVVSSQWRKIESHAVPGRGILTDVTNAFCLQYISNLIKVPETMVS